VPRFTTGATVRLNRFEGNARGGTNSLNIEGGAVEVSAPPNFRHGPGLLEPIRGAWQNGPPSLEDCHSRVCNFVQKQFLFPGNLMTMADQVRRAVAWVYRNAASFGGDRNRIYISGHSSGAHLTGVALTTDWQKSYGLPADIIKGGLLRVECTISIPSACRRGAVTSISPAKPSKNSAHGVNLDRLNAPVIVAHGTLETPEFQRQNREFAAAVKSPAKP